MCSLIACPGGPSLTALSWHAFKAHVYEWYHMATWMAVERMARQQQRRKAQGTAGDGGYTAHM